MLLIVLLSGYHALLNILSIYFLYFHLLIVKYLFVNTQFWNAKFQDVNEKKSQKIEVNRVVKKWSGQPPLKNKYQYKKYPSVKNKFKRKR